MKAEHKVIRENWGLAYTARFVLCPSESPPLRVSLVEKMDDLKPATVSKCKQCRYVHNNGGEVLRASERSERAKSFVE